MKFKELPRRSESEHLEQLAGPDERFYVRLEIQSTSFGPITIAGRSTKTYTFRRDPNGGCHILRVPLSLWQADDGALARDMMNKAGPSLYRIVPFFEEAAKAATPEEKQEEQEPLPREELPAQPEIPEFDPDDFDIPEDDTLQPEEPTTTRRKRKA